LAVPALSQQSPSTQSSNPPAASQPADQSAPAQPSSTDQASSTHQPLTYERHEGFWGKMNPFARKKYVQRQLTPVRDRMNELDELTAKNASAIRDVDSRATEGIRPVQNSQKMADAVVRYLVLNHEIPVYRIYTLGLGNAPVQASANGTRARRTTGGRVEVSLLKNEGLSGMQSAASGNSTGAPNAGGSMDQSQGQPTQPNNSLPQADQAAPANAPAAQPAQQPAAAPKAQQPPPPTTPHL